MIHIHSFKSSPSHPPSPQGTTSILSDDRFKVMFENPDYQVDEESEEYRLLNPLVSKVSQKRKKKLKMLAQLEAEEEVSCPSRPTALRRGCWVLIL